MAPQIVATVIFCSVIALEIEDTGSHTFTCIGIAFEVRKNDSEIKRFVYFQSFGQDAGAFICDSGRLLLFK